VLVDEEVEKMEKWMEQVKKETVENSEILVAQRGSGGNQIVKEHK